MTALVNKLAESKFMKWLQKLSVKMSQNDVFSSLTGGMGSTMALILIGAVCQIICALGGMIAGWQAGDVIYDAIYLPYKVTMGMMGFFMCFSLAYTYAKKKKQNPVQSGFTALICYILVVAPPISAVRAGVEGASPFDAMDIAALGSGGIFVAILIAFISVQITKFAVDHNWIIKLPDSVPEGIMGGFNATIPAGIKIIFWYGLSLIISSVSGGTQTLNGLINTILAYPLAVLVNPVGMLVLIALGQIFWFFGIHGSAIIFPLLLIPLITAYSTNAALAAQGAPLVFSATFLYMANGRLGGAGNTLPLTVMGLKSKSKQISAVCKAEIGPSLFGINEPLTFGFPLMYNPIMLIPFVLAPVIDALLLWAAYALNLIAMPQVLILSLMPLGFAEFLQTLDWRNIVFTAVLFPVNWVIYYPFYKIYEKQCIANEQAAEAAEAQQ